MRKLNFSEMQAVTGGRFWDGFCSGFTFGGIGLVAAGISLGPLGIALFSSVGAGCAINSVINQVTTR